MSGQDDGFSWGNEKMESMGKEPPFDVPLYLFLKGRQRIKGYAKLYPHHGYEGIKFHKTKTVVLKTADLVGWKIFDGPITIHNLNGSKEYESFLKIAKGKGYNKNGFFKEIMNFWMKCNQGEVG